MTADAPPRLTIPLYMFLAGAEFSRASPSSVKVHGRGGRSVFRMRLIKLFIATEEHLSPAP